MTINEIFGSIVSSYKERTKLAKPNYLQHYFYRPLSFWPSALFIRLGFSANQVTFFRMAAFICVLVSLPFIPLAYRWVGALLIIVCDVLDFCDGNIARFTQKSSQFGAFVDGFFDSLAGLIFITTPFLLLANTENLLSFNTHLFLAFSTLYIYTLYNYFSVRLNLTLRLARQAKIEGYVHKGAEKDSSKIVKYYRAVQDSFNLVFLFAISFNFIEYFLIFYFLLKVPFGLAEIIAYLFKYRSELSEAKKI